VAAYSGITLSATVIAALLVCLIPTTIGGLLSAIGIAGMDRLIRKNVLAMSGRAVEAAGDVDTLLLDKTGTITIGNRMASATPQLQNWPKPRAWPVAINPAPAPSGICQKLALRMPLNCPGGLRFFNAYPHGGCDSMTERPQRHGRHCQ
jgi:hypothetical protein